MNQGREDGVSGDISINMNSLCVLHSHTTTAVVNTHICTTCIIHLCTHAHPHTHTHTHTHTHPHTHTHTHTHARSHVVAQPKETNEGREGSAGSQQAASKEPNVLWSLKFHFQSLENNPWNSLKQAVYIILFCCEMNDCVCYSAIAKVSCNLSVLGLQSLWLS